MKKTILALTILLTAPVCAEELPRPGTADNRVLFVAYDPYNVVRLVGTDMRSTEIKFGDTETVLLASVGDEKAWWHQKAGNMLFVRPLLAPSDYPTRNSNMQVVTELPDKSTRTYQFDLIGGGSMVMYAIDFTYPGEVAASKQKAYKEHQEQAEEDIARQRLEVGTYYGTRNWQYVGRGSASIRPANISDNGEQTAFRFPGNTKIPAIYEVNPDGKEQIVNFVMNQDFAVVTATSHAWKLRLGNQVYEIWNVGYNAVGNNPRTGTVSPDVVRTIKHPKRETN